MDAMADSFTSTDGLPPYVLDGLLIVLAMNLCRMLTIKTTMMLANLAAKPVAKQILTAGVFLMATQTSVMMNVTV